MTTGNTFNNLDGKLHQAPSNQERPNNENTWPDKDTLSTMQYADPTLTGVQQRVVPSQDLNKYRVCFYEENGIIMRKWQNANTRSMTLQMLSHPSSGNTTEI